jgi:hypothetical protein
MPRHDSIFKTLLSRFFTDLLRLVVPTLAGSLDLTSLDFPNKELLTAGGSRREPDLLAEVSFLGDGAPVFFIHVEVEARAKAGMGRRLWRYHNQIQASRDHDVLSVVIYLKRGGAGVQVQRLVDASLPSGLGEDFKYVAFGLAGCDAADYLARPEPLAWGLAALMQPGALTRPALKLACLRRIAVADLEGERRLLLVDFVEAYLELNSNEAEEYARLCTVRENREVREMATTWSERIRQEGVQQGLETGLQAMRTMLLTLLDQRFGPLPEETRARVEAITSLSRLSRLGEKVLTARSLAALRL